MLSQPSEYLKSIPSPFTSRYNPDISCFKSNDILLIAWSHMLKYHPSMIAIALRHSLTHSLNQGSKSADNHTAPNANGRAWAWASSPLVQTYPIRLRCLMWSNHWCRRSPSSTWFRISRFSTNVCVDNDQVFWSRNELPNWSFIELYLSCVSS